MPLILTFTLKSTIVNFPFICSNIPAKPADRFDISQLIRLYRACVHYSDFLNRAQLLMLKLLKQGYVAPKLKSSLQKIKNVRSSSPLRNIHISNDNRSFTLYVYFSFVYHCQNFYGT